MHVGRRRDRQVKRAPPGLPAALENRCVQTTALPRDFFVEGQRVKAVLDDREAAHANCPGLLVRCD